MNGLLRTGPVDHERTYDTVSKGEGISLKSPKIHPLPWRLPARSRFGEGRGEG